MENELNLYEALKNLCRAIGRVLKASTSACAHVLFMMIRYWWIFVVLMGLAAAGGWYFTRFDHRMYKANAVALINGASIQQFDQAYTTLCTPQLIPDDALIKPYLQEKVIFKLKTFYVIDALDDGIADYIDFERHSLSTDTVRVRMKDRLNLQFRIKGRDIAQLPTIENALLEYLNANTALRQSYQGYITNLREEVQFNHSQAQKLDSLTSYYYFNEKTVVPTVSKQGMNANVNLYVDNQVKLFLDEIYKQQKHMQQADYRLQLASSPVVLENHFYIDPRPVFSPVIVLICSLFIAWVLSLICAECMDKRKAISAWLKA